jgi:hypothetical protein
VTIDGQALTPLEDKWEICDPELAKLNLEVDNMDERLRQARLGEVWDS